MTLDPKDGHVRHLSAAQLMVHGRKHEAYRELTEANRLLPYHWPNYHYTAYLFRLCDMHEEAVKAWSQCVDLEPNEPWAYWGLVRVCGMLGRHAEAESWAARLFQRTGRHGDERGGLRLALAMQGRFHEIVETCAGPRGHDPATVSYIMLAVAQHVVGDRGAGAETMKRCEPLAAIDMDSAAYAAAYYGHAGDTERAFQYLDRATELGNDILLFYENPAVFGPLHQHPRWKSFIDGVRARVTEYRQSFRWPLPA